MAKTLEVDVAINSYVEGYTYFKKPGGAELRQCNSLKYIHFEQPRGRIAAEFPITDQDPCWVVKNIQAIAPNGSHYLNVITDAKYNVLQVYKKFGYELEEEKFLMVRSLAELPPDLGEAEVKVLIRWEIANQINRKLRLNPVYLAYLSDPRLTYYYLERDGNPVAWAANLLLNEKLSYVSRVFTDPDYRRQGLAEIVMKHLLAKAKACGAQHSVLVASQMGQPLYQKIGYQTLKSILVLTSLNE
jgi:GNAT superfamily N-acetyltransferase